MKKVYDWIIAIGTTEAGGIRILHIKGTVKQAKETLMEFVDQDRCGDEEGFSYGTEDVSKIEEIIPFDQKEATELNAYNVFSDYHIDYTASRLDVMEYREM